MTKPYYIALIFPTTYFWLVIQNGKVGQNFAMPKIIPTAMLNRTLTKDISCKEAYKS
jgi:hypothetical protein